MEIDDDVAQVYKKFETLPKVDRLVHLTEYLIQYLVNDVQKAIQLLRLFDNDDASGAAMRTILIATKGYVWNTEVTEIVDSIYERLKIKLNGKLF